MKGFEPLIMISKTTALPLGYISEKNKLNPYSTFIIDYYLLIKKMLNLNVKHPLNIQLKNQLKEKIKKNKLIKAP